MTVLPTEDQPMVYMLEADLYGPAERAVMAAGDLGIEPVKTLPKRHLALADDPERLRIACRSAGIIDAYNSRKPATCFVGEYGAAYNDGYQYELTRQKIVPRPPLIIDNRPRVIDPAVQATRDRLRNV